MTERITFRQRTTRTVRCKCVCVCSVLCLSASCLPPWPLSTHFLLHTQSEVWPHLYLHPPFVTLSIFCLGYSSPTSLNLLLVLLCRCSHFHLPDSPLLYAPPPAGSLCSRTARRRPWIRPLKGTSMWVRTTLCRSWPRRSWGRSRGWQEMTCAVTAERLVSGRDGWGNQSLWCEKVSDLRCCVFWSLTTNQTNFIAVFFFFIIH